MGKQRYLTEDLSILLIIQCSLVGARMIGAHCARKKIGDVHAKKKRFRKQEYALVYLSALAMTQCIKIKNKRSKLDR